MTCPEQRLVAFLAGELSPEEERRFDEHLLGCEQCWRAVQADRAARLALEQLRQPAPAGLQGRVAALGRPRRQPKASQDGPGRGWPGTQSVPAPSLMRRAATRPHVRLVAAACLLVVVAAGSFGWLAASRSAAPEPAQVAAVVAMMTPGSAPTTALRAGEHLVIGGQAPGRPRLPAGGHRGDRGHLGPAVPRTFNVAPAHRFLTASVDGHQGPAVHVRGQPASRRRVHVRRGGHAHGGNAPNGGPPRPHLSFG